MNKKYNLKFDLQFRCNNSKMIFDEFDENTSDFFMQITRQGQLVDISNAIPTLLVLKPSGVAVSQILNVKDNLIYGNLNNSLKNEVGTYIAKLMLVEGNKKTFISNISYEVTENALLGMIDDDIVEDERYSVLLQLLERLSNIELQEQTRIDNENSRIEAENLREESIEKIKNDIDFLINETNKKVNDNLNTNASKIDNLIIDTKEELNKYKENKDKFINEDLEEFKENTNKSIDNYKASKDVEINNALDTYKTNTTNDINSFKNTINSKIDKYKNDKDQAINEYIEGKSLELGNYVEAKNNELDLYVSEKNTLIDSKISEVDSAKTQIQDSINNKLIEVDNAEQIRQQEHESRQQFLDGFEGKLNTVVDDVAGIKDDVVSVREANKRQDVFLQGLYNENLDGRVTVKEEGSIISLINSDDGLVDIVGLEGNTLVNYVQDGSKELTLNGDIEAEGTSVTLTEGVDNGLVDVACEGNTLVNLWGLDQAIISGQNYREGTHIKTTTTTNVYSNFFLEGKERIKPTTNYTLIAFVFKNTLTSRDAVYLTSYSGSDSSASDIFTNNASQQKVINGGETGVFKFLLTSKSDFTVSDYVIRGFVSNQSQTPGCELDMQLMLLEGDWTNKETPPYFEGMKSVGELEDNKLEVVSQNKNILPINYGVKVPFYIKQGTTLTLSTKDRAISKGGNIKLYDANDNIVWFAINAGLTNVTKTLLKDIYYMENVLQPTNEYELKYQLEIGNVITSYTEPTFNTKEITLSEPLRALPNGVKDKVVKIGGKWYVERNCGEVVLNGSEDWSDYNTYTNDIITTKATRKPSDCKSKSKIVCRDFYTKDPNGIDECIAIGLNNLELSIKTSKLSSQTITDFKKWLSANPTTIVYELETPIYEELPISPTLNTYNDITHISNNSTIPCNMKVKNTGYNAIIKPSTQYTVAFDTDKSGEVGIDLAGSKVTTTNNVATVTTPSTLTDDTLRLTGKGIKASNVRLLEGDKTNCIPSYFEGMKSSFEDKLQEDGSYNVEILSRNKNLFNGKLLKGYSISYITGDYVKSENYVSSVDFIPVKPLTCYSVNLLSSSGTCFFVFYDKNKKSLGGSQVWDYKKTPSNCYYMKMYYNKNFIDILTQVEEGTVITDYTPHKSNKIQFPMIEPLRGVGDVKDRFVFKKDGKLMIERSCSIREYQEGDYELSNVLTDEVNTVYILDIPIYEEIPFELQKIILEGYENGTLFFDTNIPPTVETSYTANIPVVSKLNKVNETTETNTEDIAITQMAVDFLLMSSLGEEMINFKVKGGTNMSAYFASRIIKGALKYEDVVNKYPQYKEDIDLILIAEGYSDLIVEL